MCSGSFVASQAATRTPIHTNETLKSTALRHGGRFWPSILGARSPAPGWRPEVHAAAPGPPLPPPPHRRPPTPQLRDPAHAPAPPLPPPRTRGPPTPELGYSAHSRLRVLPTWVGQLRRRHPQCPEISG